MYFWYYKFRSLLYAIFLPLYCWVDRHKILSLRGQYAGKRCFIIGSGQSLKSIDLTKLNNEYVCTVGKAYKLKNRGLKKASFHVFFDRSGFRELDINPHDSYFEKVFISRSIFQDREFKNRYFFNVFSRYFFCASSHFQDNSIWPLFDGCSVVLPALQLMFYLGFSELVLLGVDLSFDLEKDSYFYEPSLGEKKRLKIGIRNKKTIEDSLKYAACFLKKNGVKLKCVSNHVNFIEKVSFESLF